MSESIICPSCGAKIEDKSAIQCPFCGSALSTVGSSAPTLISRPLSQKAQFENSAEAMDEIKRLVNEGDTSGATQIAGSAFNLPDEAAQTVIEQVKTDMPFTTSSSDKTMMASSASIAAAAADVPEHRASSSAPSSTPVEVVDAGSARAYNAPPEPPKQSNRQKWIIGGSIGAAVFLCLCCCMPIALWLFMFRNR
jgi:hypothetical protein